uniref:Uncharacterized protein n=1 Tax=Glossina austeni TaxID=7395 RepID=A0A1A9VKS9_GLOAU
MMSKITAPIFQSLRENRFPTFQISSALRELLQKLCESRNPGTQCPAALQDTSTAAISSAYLTSIMLSFTLIITGLLRKGDIICIFSLLHTEFFTIIAAESAEMTIITASVIEIIMVPRSPPQAKIQFAYFLKEDDALGQD